MPLEVLRFRVWGTHWDGLEFRVRIWMMMGLGGVPLQHARGWLDTWIEGLSSTLPAGLRCYNVAHLFSVHVLGILLD